jgi:TRAP-type C4-dicarboxylate transport system permease small subunit
MKIGRNMGKDRLKNLLLNADLYCGVFLLLSVLVITSLQVILRYVFSFPLPWPEEVTTNMLVWITFLGGSIVTRREEHIKVAYFVQFLPKRALGWLFLLLDILIACFLIAILVGCFPVFKKLRLILLPATQISINWVFASVPISASIMLLYYLSAIWDQLRRLVRGEEVPLEHRLH